MMIKEDWLSPLNKMIIQKAVKAKETSVTIRDGRKFTLDYEKRGSEGLVLIKPHKHSGSFVPMGYFDIKKISHLSWLSEDRTDRNNMSELIPKFDRPSMVDKVVSPEDEIFWRDVRIAYDQVNLNPERQVKITRGNKEATIKMLSTNHNFIVIGIQPIDPETPTLIKPS